MPQFFPGARIPFFTTVQNNGVTVTTPEIVFVCRHGEGGEEETIVPTLAGDRYEVTVTARSPGGYRLFWRWDTNGLLDAATEGFIVIRRSAFDDQTAGDYI